MLPHPTKKKHETKTSSHSFFQPTETYDNYQSPSFFVVKQGFWIVNLNFGWFKLHVFPIQQPLITIFHGWTSQLLDLADLGSPVFWGPARSIAGPRSRLKIQATKTTVKPYFFATIDLGNGTYQWILVGGFGTWILWLSIQLGISWSQLTFIFFQRGRYTTNQDWFKGSSTGNHGFYHQKYGGFSCKLSLEPILWTIDMDIGNRYGGFPEWGYHGWFGGTPILGNLHMNVGLYITYPNDDWRWF